MLASYHRTIGFYSCTFFQVETILDEWRDYKLSVPTYGAIILNEDLTQVGANSLHDVIGVEL